MPPLLFCQCMYILQAPSLLDLFIRLNLVIWLEILKVFQANTTFCSLAHFLDILLHMFQSVYLACL